VTVFLGAQFSGTWMGRVTPVTFSSCLTELTSLVFRHICMDTESTSYFCPSVWLSVCPYTQIGAAPTGQIYVKFDTGDLYIRLITWIPTYVLLLLITLNYHASVLFEWNGIRQLGQPRWYKYYMTALQYYITCTMPILDVLLWVVTQKSADLLYIAVEAWIHAMPILVKFHRTWFLIKAQWLWLLLTCLKMYGVEWDWKQVQYLAMDKAPTEQW
jgi:hypothetical protein